MDQHDETGSPTGSESGFIPDAYHRPGPEATTRISPLRRRWRLPAVATSMAVVAALCLHDGSTAHATAAPKPAAVSALAAHGAGAKSVLPMHFEAAADSTHGGVHGAFNLYDGVGGGIEFWFDPNTGSLTVAVGAGVGEGGGGVLGTYAPGSVPEPGTYVYANADLGAGTVATVNVSGTYSLDNGVFVGSVNTTVDGRTLTIASDGGSTFDVNVVASESATGFTGAIGVNYTFNFNVTDVIDYIWNAIKDFFTADYSLEDDDDSGDDTSWYSDDSSTDDSIGSDDASDDSGDDSGDDAGDDGGDGGDGGGGGCFLSYHYLPDHTSSTKVTHSAAMNPNLLDEDDGDPIECE